MPQITMTGCGFGANQSQTPVCSITTCSDIIKVQYLFSLKLSVIVIKK